MEMKQANTKLTMKQNSCYRRTHRSGMIPKIDTAVVLLFAFLFNIFIVHVSFVSSTFYVSKSINPILLPKQYKSIQRHKVLLPIQTYRFNLHLFPSIHMIETTPTITTTSSIILSNTVLTTLDSIRQYVPLIVILFVLLDIVLGSPFANSIIQNLQSSSGSTTTTDVSGENDSNLLQQSMKQQQQRKERIDSQKVAQDAIQRAKYTLELNEYLNQQRDPMKVLQQQIQNQTIQLNENQKLLQKEIRKE